MTSHPHILLVSSEEHNLIPAKMSVEGLRAYWKELEAQLSNISAAREYMDQYMVGKLTSSAALKKDFNHILALKDRIVFVHDTLQTALTTIEETRPKGKEA